MHCSRVAHWVAHPVLALNALSTAMLCSYSAKDNLQCKLTAVMRRQPCSVAMVSNGLFPIDSIARNAARTDVDKPKELASTHHAKASKNHARWCRARYFSQTQDWCITVNISLQMCISTKLHSNITRDWVIDSTMHLFFKLEIGVSLWVEDYSHAL